MRNYSSVLNAMVVTIAGWCIPRCLWTNNQGKKQIPATRGDFFIPVVIASHRRSNPANNEHRHFAGLPRSRCFLAMTGEMKCPAKKTSPMRGMDIINYSGRALSPTLRMPRERNGA